MRLAQVTIKHGLQPSQTSCEPDQPPQQSQSKSLSEPHVSLKASEVTHTRAVPSINTSGKSEPRRVFQWRSPTMERDILH